MDEIDAPLDDANVTRFNELLRSIGEKSQIVMITHNKQSMEFADTLFGITMEKKGVSKVVSVNLEREAAYGWRPDVEGQPRRSDTKRKNERRTSNVQRRTRMWMAVWMEIMFHRLFLRRREYE